MSRKFLTSVDFSKNEIQNAVAQVLSAAPAGAVPGQFYFNSTSGKLEYRGATAWIDATARSNHTGTQTAATISDFVQTVQSQRLDQMAAPTTAVSLNGQQISNLADPIQPQDAATKNYVDSAINGTDWKNSVRVGSTANIASLAGLLTIDGVTLVAGDRVLVKNQSQPIYNGIYVAAAGAWNRSIDADTGTKVTSGLSVMITEGTTNASTQWRLITADSIVLGTTPLSFTQIGASISYAPGTGVGIVGNVISIDPALVVRKYAQTFGDGTATSIAITHGLSTLDALVQVYEVSTGATIECDVIRNSTNQVTLGFALAPASNSLRVLVQG